MANAEHPNTRAPRLLAAALLATGLLAGLSGCGLFGKPPGDDAPTLASLKGRSIAVPPAKAVAKDEARTAAAYRDFLAAAPGAPQRPEAMRRLGDLEMDGAERRLADGALPDYKAAIERYQAFLQAYPSDPGNDRVLYQLARAQEQGGALEEALKTLGRLVAGHPNTAYADEAQFRRGELLFATRDYSGAEAAYATVLKSGAATPYAERALYMQGWSLFKQARLDDALRPFFGVLDIELAKPAPLARAAQELVDDSLRVVSIALSNLQGAASIAPLIDSPARLAWEHRVYEQLGALYLRQDRVKDAADTLAAFARLRPLHAQAPLLQAQVIEIYAANGFATLALDAKKDYVVRYGADSDFRRANPAGWTQAQPLLKTHLAALAQHHHALAQKSRNSDDTTEAVRWYRLALATFPDDADAAANNFLLAELLFDDKRFAAAAVEYEQVAYGRSGAARGADAGYAALLAYGHIATPQAQRSAVDSALRFADTYAADSRSGGVLTHAAEQLFALKDSAQAAATAQRALKLPLAAAQRRTAWTVVAHEAFERQAWPAAEQAYGQALAAAPAPAAGADKALAERQAAAIYQQGDAARAAGRQRDAVAFFARVAGVAPDSGVRAAAQFDAATALIAVQDWEAAARLLEDFRQRFPQHALQAEVGGKLAAAYLATAQWTQAAAEFERAAAAAGADPEVARAALWQAAELHDKAADGQAAKAYESYLRRHPQPLQLAVQARFRLAELSPADKALAWLKEVVLADATGGSARTERTQALAARASLALAAPLLEAYRKLALVEPLQKQLKLKRGAMDEVLKAYAAAAAYGVAEASTAATFHTAALYQDFGRALLASQRPKKLSKAELEQYNVLLEEQAFPFEEKAIGLHEANAARAAAGLYDDWVKASFAALAQLKPVRWGKAERADAASALNQQGIDLRGQGRFDKARQAYEQAIAQDPKAATPVLNLAILNDLYLNDRGRALELYERFQAMSLPADAAVGRWLAELKARKPAATTTTASPTANATNVVSASGRLDTR